jgi:hydrophobic/amphiphilic exporter-1 (mainly G- bacteria), HAE1 family
MNFTDFSVDRPVAISMLVAIVMVLGIISLGRLGIDMLPEIDYPTLSVMVRYPGAPPQEIEAMVAKPYEGALAAVNGVKKIRSVSQEDAVYLMLDFVWGTDLDAAAADIRESVAMIEPYMPPDVEDPIVLKFDLSAMPLAIYAVTGLDDTIQLRELMEDEAQPRFERLKGVAQAAFLGGRVEEIQVDLDRAALAGSGVGIEQIAMSLTYQNLNLPAGRLVISGKERLLRTVGMFESLHEIEQTSVGISPATMGPIQLGTLAKVHRGTRDLRNMVRAHGQEALMLMLLKESDANPLQVRELVIEQVEGLESTLPEGVDFGLLMDIGMLIEQMAANVVNSGLIGAFLAILVMFLFLRNIRPTLAIAIAIPLSLLATFIPIYAMGETLNMMTMGGLVLGIGMLLDNAVVVIENIFRHIEEGKDRHTAAKIGAREVGMAITASTFTTMVVFLPILFSQGLAGQMAKGLAVTVAAALFASLFVALTIVPMLASVFFSSKVEKSVLREGRVFARVKGVYERVLRWALSHRKTTLGLVGLLMVGTLALVPMVGAEFMPTENRPILIGKFSFPIGTPIDQTASASRHISEAFEQFEDVATAGESIGVDENDAGAGMSDMNPSGPHEGIIFARLVERDLRTVPSNEELMARIREAIPPIHDMDFQFVDMGSGMSGSSHPIEVKLYGDDFDTLHEWADVIAARMMDIEGLVDVDTTMQVAKPESHILIDRAKASRYGLTVGQVATVIKTATLGTVVTRYRKAGEELDVRLRYAEGFRDSRDALRQIQIPLPITGGSIPLGQIAHVEDGLGPVKVVREDQTRMVSVVADLDGLNLSEAMQELNKVVGPLEEQLPQGYTMDYAGQYEDMMSAFQQLLMALILAILMVYMVMAAQFESFTHPFTIMFTMPLALIGVIWLFFLTGTTLSVPTFLGVLMLAGIVVNNGIVLIDYVNQLRRDGMEIFEAVVKGSTTRLRPVLITSLTTMSAMIPMAVSNMEGSETMSPLAYTIIGGLAAASALTLLVIPVVYMLVDTYALRVKHFWIRLLHRDELKTEVTP